jgi:hypothetical protein
MSEQCAVEQSEHINVYYLCVTWTTFRTCREELKNMLHGFLLISQISPLEAAYSEIKFLIDVLESEEKR